MDFHSMAHTSRNEINFKNSQTYTEKWGKKTHESEKIDDESFEEKSRFYRFFQPYIGSLFLGFTLGEFAHFDPTLEAIFSNQNLP